MFTLLRNKYFSCYFKHQSLSDKIGAGRKKITPTKSHNLDKIPRCNYMGYLIFKRIMKLTTDCTVSDSGYIIPNLLSTKSNRSP